MESRRQIFRISGLSKALSEEIRIRILLCLQGGPLSLNYFVNIFELAPCTLSKHLHILEYVGLAVSIRQVRDQLNEKILEWAEGLLSFYPSVQIEIEGKGSSTAPVVQGVARDKFGIGYSGIGYRTADVRVVPLSATMEGKAVEAAPENAYTGEYPLARFLYVYVNHRPGSELDPLNYAFWWPP